MDLENQVSPVAETQNPAPETDAAPLEQPEIVTPTEEAQKPDDAPEDQAAKTARNLQRRIDRLTAAKYQTQAEVNQARQESEQLKARLAQYEQPEQQSQQPDPVAIAKELTRIEKSNERANSIAKEGKAKFAGAFDDAVKAIHRDVGPMFDQYGRPSTLGEVLMASDDPATVMHAIGTDPDLAAELADLTPIQQARRIARLEIELSKPKEPPASAAPKPLQALKGANAAGTKDPSQMTDREFAEWRKRQIAARR